MSDSGLFPILGWSLDFVRALYYRPLLARLLFRLAVGRDAYDEFLGLALALQNEGYEINLGYDLREASYHSHQAPIDFRRALSPNLD